MNIAQIKLNSVDNVFLTFIVFSRLIKDQPNIGAILIKKIEMRNEASFLSS